jgi:hypothetical protein
MGRPKPVAALDSPPHQNTIPPETSIVVPVVQSASSDTANETAAAISPGIPTRPSGVLPTMTSVTPFADSALPLSLHESRCDAAMADESRSHWPLDLQRRPAPRFKPGRSTARRSQPTPVTLQAVRTCQRHTPRQRRSLKRLKSNPMNCRINRSR